MNRPWFGLALAVCAGGFLLGYRSHRVEPPGAEERSSSGFDLDVAASSGRAKALTRAVPGTSPVPLRDAVAATRPEGPRPASRLEAKDSEGVRKDPLFESLLASPVDFMVKRTHLGRPEKLKAFLGDGKRVERYLGHPLIRGVLDNPAFVRVLVGRPMVVRGFLSSPAMQDPQAVSALASSRLLQELTHSRGVKAMMDDPQFMRKVLTDPRTAAWLARNPNALAALRGLGSGFSR